ncbi:hypothetical protein NCC78_16585 [Micromonospora phytophila]|uniref:hypothetical protein n=1 Tax=Micromonospora phytophila TaxID=709888 RepID=UPI002030FDFD|nr:hypothetical protein [Micromonospora phytophila]MCM0676296.1 hypothetical protein [Micromonospora phytophila]
MTGINPSRPPDGAAGAGQQARQAGQQARQEASQMGQQAAHAGGQVAHAAAEQGGHVAAEAKHQALNLAGEATNQLRGQAGAQQRRAAEGLRGFGRDLGSMAERCPDSGLAGQAVRRAADAAQQAAGWLDEREPAAVLDEVRDYARRHPGTFLAGAALTGLLVGRLTRNLTSSGAGGATSQGGARGAPGARPQVAPATGGPRAYEQVFEERTVDAPYAAEEAYVGSARVRSATPPGGREPDIPGGVAP